MRVALVIGIALWAVWLRPPHLGGTTGYIIVSGTSMEPRMHTGDLVLVRRKPSYEVGDVVAFRVPAGQAGAGAMVIHRIIGGSAAEGYILQGDNRTTRDLWRPKPAEVLGEEWLMVPKVGSIFAIGRQPMALGAAAAVFAFMWCTSPRRDEEQDEPRARETTRE